MFIDIEVYDLHEISSSSKTYYYLFTIGVTLLPMIAVFTIQQMDFNYFKNITHFYLIVLNIFFLLIFLFDKFYYANVGYRFIVSKNDFDYLNAVSIAVYAGLLVIFSFINPLKGIYNYVFMFLGFFLLLTTASRGPTLFVLLSLLFIVLFKDRKLGVKYLYLIVLVIFSVIINYLLSLAFRKFYQAGNPFFHRINNFDTDQSTVSRLKIVKDAIAQIVEAPLLGSHFLVLESEMYAHNIVLDILLSTGIVGLLLVIPIFWVFAKKLIGNNLPSFILIVGFYLFLNTLTSGACYKLTEFWIFFVFIIAYRFRPNNSIISQNKA